MQFKTRKAIFLLSLSAALSFGAAAQSLDEGIKMVNYERFKTAQSTLGSQAAGNPLANYYLGLAQLGAGDNAAAQATFQKFPDDPANKAGLARLAFLNKDAARGMQLATEVANSARKKDWQQLAWAADAINYGGGDAQAAINYYKEAIKRGGDNVGVRIGLGDAFLRLSTAGGGEAMNNYEKAVSMDPKNSLGYSRIGKLWYDARNFNDALSNWEKAKNADPNNPLPYRDLADAYFRVGKYDLAKQNIEKYYELSDKDCDDQISYANILFLAKDYQKAVDMMHPVLTTCGEKPFMYRVLGRSYFELKDYNSAQENMRTFFVKQAAHPDRTGITPDDYMYMGKIFGAQKQADSADFYITKALAADTSSDKHQTYIDIAESYKDMATETGYRKASQYYHMAAQTDKATATDYFWWGYYAYRVSDYKEAATAFEQMETKYPDQPSASYWRARVAAAQDNEGKTGAAVPFFQKWLSMPETNGYTRKPEDLNVAYQYLAIVAYNKDDKAAVKENIQKIRAIDPNNALAKQLEDLINKSSAPAKSKAATKSGANSKTKR